MAIKISNYQVRSLDDLRNLESFKIVFYPNGSTHAGIKAWANDLEHPWRKEIPKKLFEPHLYQYEDMNSLLKSIENEKDIVLLMERDSLPAKLKKCKAFVSELGLSTVHAVHFSKRRKFD